MLARRHVAAALAAFAIAGGCVQAARADTYPSRVIKLVVPFTPGSPNDVMARLLNTVLMPLPVSST